jgi:hypothetical protein
MKTGSNNLNRFKYFQIRWKEKLGYNDNPYLIRWTFIIFGYSIRIHHWIKSDDNRHFHDHSSDLLSIVLKGNYYNVKPILKYKDPSFIVEERDHPDECSPSTNEKWCYVEGIFNSWKNFFNMKNSIWFSKATDQHYLSIPKEGAWTLLLEGRPYHKWGFYVNEHKWRPLRYFNKFGIIQNKNYQ